MEMNGFTMVQIRSFMAFVLALLTMFLTGSARAQLSDAQRLRQYEELTFDPKSLEMIKPRSDFARRGVSGVPFFANRFDVVPFFHRPLPPMRVQPGSLAAKESQLAFLLMDIRYVHAPLAEYTANYRQAQGGYPKIEWEVQYVDQRMRAVQSLLDEFGNLMARESPEVAKPLIKEIDDFNYYMELLFEELKSQADDRSQTLFPAVAHERLQKMFRISKQLEMSVSGFVGELYMGVSLPETVGISLRILDTPPLKALIDQVWFPLQKRLEKDSELFRKFEAQYPILFNRALEHFQYDGRDVQISNVYKRMMWERPDVIRKEGEAIFLGESKMNYEVLDLALLQRTAGAVTLEEQLQLREEIVKLLRSLGLDIRMELMASGGVDEEFANRMKAKGWALYSPIRPSCSSLLKPPPSSR